MHRSFVLLWLVLLLGVGLSSPVFSNDEDALKAKADRLHRQAIVVDTHNDVTMAILDFDFDLATDGNLPNGIHPMFCYEGTQAGCSKEEIYTHTDLRRMKSGGIDAEFFSIWPDPEFEQKAPAEGGGAARRAMDMIDAVHRQVQRHPD